jgi:hypothetical protein
MAPRCCIPLLCLLPALLPTLLLPAPLEAQADTTRFDRLWQGDYDGPRRLELSVAGGYALSTDWSDMVALQLFDVRGGIHRQVLLRNMAVAPGAGGTAAVTYWRGRHAFRVHAGYSRSCLTTAARCVDGQTAPPANGAALAVAEVPMDVWRYGVDGLVGLRNWAGSRFWRPYLVIGAGGVTYDPDGDALPFVPGTFETLVPPPDLPAGTVVISNGTTTLLVATGELGLEHVFGVTVGAGMDFRIPVGIGGLGVRLELVDQITNSPFHVTVTRLGGDGGRFDVAGDETTFRAGAVHNLRLTAGITVELGLPGPRAERDPWQLFP